MNADQLAVMREWYGRSDGTHACDPRVLALCDEVERLQTANVEWITGYERLAREKERLQTELADELDRNKTFRNKTDRLTRERDKARAELAAARDALERLSRNFDLLLARKPVRDVAETKAEVDAVLARVAGTHPQGETETET